MYAQFGKMPRAGRIVSYPVPVDPAEEIEIVRPGRKMERWVGSSLASMNKTEGRE